MVSTKSPEDAYTAEPFVPGRGGLAALRKAAVGCRGCPLHRDATQTVFGEGSAHARVMLVGEQPGDQEDR
ncbi:MAG: uracil-DNA glycosylase, partial [Streptomyces sp.]